MKTLRLIGTWFVAAVGVLTTVLVGLFVVGLGVQGDTGELVTMQTLSWLQLGSPDLLTIFSLHVQFVGEWLVFQRPGDGFAMFGVLVALGVLYSFGRVGLWIESQPIPHRIGAMKGYPRVNIGALTEIKLEIDTLGLPTRYPRLPKGCLLICSVTVTVTDGSDIEFWVCYNYFDVVEMYNKLHRKEILDLEWHFTKLHDFVLTPQ